MRYPVNSTVGVTEKVAPTVEFTHYHVYPAKKTQEIEPIIQSASSITTKATFHPM